MCWTAQVSVGFGLVHLLGFALTERKSYRTFTAFYALMEFYQAFQWIWGDVHSCTDWNSQVTVVAYGLIWFQPWLYVIMGEAEGLRLQYAKLASMTTYIWSLFTLVLGMHKIPTYSLPNSSFGSVTCTSVGPHGHLNWTFSPITIAYQPTHYVYVLLIGTTMLYYPPQLNIIKWGWLGTLLISLYSVGTGAELPAVWCWSSLLVSLPLIMTSLKQRWCNRNV